MKDLKGGKGLLLIGMADKAKSSEDEGKSDPKGGALSAAKALLKAVKADDAEAVDEALRLHYALGSESESDEE